MLVPPHRDSLLQRSRGVPLVVTSLLMVMGAASNAQGVVGPQSEHLASLQGRNDNRSNVIPTVTLTLNNVARDAAIRAVAEAAGYEVVYSPQFVKLAGTVNVRFSNTSFTEAVATILRGSGVTSKISTTSKSVLLAPETMAQRDAAAGVKAARIQGRVTDSASGSGIGGVTVSVRGVNLAKTTNGNGEFTLEGVPAGEQTIEFKIVGYRAFSKSIRVNDGETATVNAVMRPSATMLSEVVTTAVGQQQRREVGYTINSINVDSLIRIAPIKSTTDLFENRIPGVTVQRTSGSPGDPARIRFRGTKSISENNDPIIYVDGVRRYGGQSDERNVAQGAAGSYATTSPLDQIDPNTIERIDVLKGPAASAIYGSDASSGVIAITTKKGRAGPPQWGVILDAGTSEFRGSWPITTYNWVTPISGGLPALCLGFCGNSRIDSVRRFQALNEPYLTPLGRGYFFKPNVSLSGGGGPMNYSFIATSFRDRGILKLPDIEVARYERYQGKAVPAWMLRPDVVERNTFDGNVGITLNPEKNTNLRYITGLTQEVQRKTSMTSSNNTAISALQGVWVDQNQLSQDVLIGNPYERITTPKVLLSNTIQFSTNAFTWLNARGTAGINSSTSNRSQVIEPGLLAPPTNSQPDLSGGSYYGQSVATQNATLRVDFSTPIMRRIQTNAGFNFDRQRNDDQNGRFFGIAPGTDDPSSGVDSARNKFSRNTRETVDFGYYLQPRLILSSRLNLTPGFRLDRNGLAGENAGFNGLPKMDFSWVVSEEPFFTPLQSVINELRVRSAFGVSGKQPTTGDLFRQYALRTINPVSGGTQSLYGSLLQLSNLGNSRLRPERVREFDGGFDLSLWNSRANLSFGYVYTFTKDMITQYSVATSAAGNIPSLRANFGDVRNQTVEVSLNAAPLERPNLGFDFLLNFDRQRSLIVRLAPDAPTSASTGQSTNPDGTTQFIAGYPMDGIWMRPIRGYSDLDGNGWISKSELVVGKSPVFVGAAYPSYNLSFHPKLRLFKMFTIASSISHVSGQVQTLKPFSILSSSSFAPGAPFISDLVFGVEGFDRQAAYVAANMFIYNSQGSQIGYTQTIDATRLEYVSVTTNLSPRVARFVRAKTVDMSIRGNNLALWTNYIGVDPNVNANFGNSGLFDNGALPKVREWSINFNLRF